MQKFQIGVLPLLATLAFASTANAEVVWTCTQPSAIDGAPAAFRYNIASASEIIDELGLHWTIVRNDGWSVVATFDGRMSSQTTDAGRVRTISINARTGTMVLAILDLASPVGGTFVRGTCVKS